MRSFMFGSRRRVIITALVAALALPGAALAAWIIYSGVGGSASGSFTSTTTTQNAITVQLQGVPALAGPGDSEQMSVVLKNADPSNAHAVTALTGTAFSSTPSDCAAHLTYTDGGGSLNPIIGTSVPAGGQVNSAGVTIHADASLPSDCVGGSYTLSFAGTTS